LNKFTSLLEKFRNNELLPDEARELASLVKDGDDHPEVKNLMSDTWAMSENTAANIPTKRMLIRLRPLLHPAAAERMHNPPGRWFASIRPFYRYAALVFVTAGITWALQSLLVERKNPLPRAGKAYRNNEVSVSYGSKSRIVLPDGSVVNLNSGSILRYPADFNANERGVFIEGEAFFDVKRNNSIPFYVKTRDITIRVLGTRFNVKSYSDDNVIETTLVSGTIEIYANQEVSTNQSRILVLKPNQQAIFRKQTGQLAVSGTGEKMESRKIKPARSLLVQKKTDLSPIISWKDNRLIFRDESFSDLSRRLERWYDVEIDIKDDELARAKFSGIFVRETIEQALNALKLATPFDYCMNKNKIVISK
jgi:ferric-dicitrate binding protein FerR (iron transport regulator)